jgi:hypothetical protein
LSYFRGLNSLILALLPFFCFLLIVLKAFSALPFILLLSEAFLIMDLTLLISTSTVAGFAPPLRGVLDHLPNPQALSSLQVPLQKRDFLLKLSIRI